MLKRLPMFKKLLLCSASAALISCGGGDEIVSTSSSASATAVTGYLSKGPITGAVCNLFNSANQQVLTATTTAGVINFGNLTTAGAYSASCTGGTYTDEATGQVVTNTTVLRSGIVIDAAGSPSAQMTVSPLSEMVYQSAGGDPTKMAAAAKTIAQAFGLPATIDLLSTVPTDVNTSAASNNAAGQYGTLLAAIAQMQKDQGVSLGSLISTLAAAVTTNSAGVATLSAGVANQIATAATNLADPTKNSNPAVQANTAVTKAAVSANVVAAADNTPFVNRLSITSAANGGGTVSVPLFGSTYTFTASGGNLAAASLATSNMTCAAPTLSAASVVASCVMGATSATATFAVQAGGVTVKGLAPSTTIFLGSGSQSCQSSAIVTEVSPTNFTYAAQGTGVTIKGCSLSPNAALTLAGLACSPIAGNTGNQLRYTCNVTNTRPQANENEVRNNGVLLLTGFGAGTASNSTSVTFAVPPIVALAATPASLIQGAQGSSNMTIAGTGLFNSMYVNLGSTRCTSQGTANATGTQLTGVDCANAQVSQTANTATLVVGSGLLSSAITISLTPAPTPTIAVGGSNNLQMGGTTQLTAQSNSTASFVYSVVSGGSNASVNTSGLVTGLAVGSAQIQVSQAAVVGQFAAGVATFNVNVTAQTVPVISFAANTKAVKLGDADFTNAATVTCATGGTSYAPTITYSATTGSGLVMLNAATGAVALKGAGQAAIQASVPAVGTCAAAQSTSYPLTINKATPVVVFGTPTTSMGFGQAGPVNVASVSAPASLGTQPLPSVANLTLTYASASTTVATVDPMGAITGLAVGSSLMSASSAADDNYAIGNATPYALAVGKANPTLAFASTSTLAVQTRAPAITSSASLSGVQGTPPAGMVTYSSANSTIASVDAEGNVLGLEPGSTSITANYAGDANYNAASAQLTVTVTVGACLSVYDTEAKSSTVQGTFTYTGLPGGNVEALKAYDFCGGQKVLFWNPRIDAANVATFENPGLSPEVQLRNFGIDDRIVISESSGLNVQRDRCNVSGVCSGGVAVSNIHQTVGFLGDRTELTSSNGYDVHQWHQRNLTDGQIDPNGPTDTYRWENLEYFANTRAQFAINSYYKTEPKQVCDDRGEDCYTELGDEFFIRIKLTGFPSFYTNFPDTFSPTDAQGNYIWRIYEFNVVDTSRTNYCSANPAAGICPLGAVTYYIRGDTGVTYRRYTAGAGLITFVP